MNWPFRRRGAPASPRLPHAYPIVPVQPRDDLAAIAALAAFACSTCGRTDLRPAGDWTPPVCEECDAAINVDVEPEEPEELEELGADD